MQVKDDKVFAEEDKLNLGKRLLGEGVGEARSDGGK